MKKLFYQKIILVFGLSILTVIFTVTNNFASELKRYLPNQSEVEIGSKRFFYDNNFLDLETAKNLANYIFSTYGKDDVPLFYMMPQSESLFLVSAYGKSTDNDEGRRLILLRKNNIKFEELFVGQGAGDSYILRPIFFSDHERVFILAELGTEYSWGFDVYEFYRGKIIKLGKIDVSFESDSPFSDPVNPLEKIKVEYKSGTYYVSFFVKLYFPGSSEDSKFIGSSNEPVIFYFDGDNFVIQVKKTGSDLHS